MGIPRSLISGRAYLFLQPPSATTCQGRRMTLRSKWGLAMGLRLIQKLDPVSDLEDVSPKYILHGNTKMSTLPQQETLWCTHTLAVLEMHVGML